MSLAVDLATPADDPAIRALLRSQAMPGRIRISYEREPEFRLGCEVTGEDCQVLVARRDNSAEVVGLACRSVRYLFLNGKEQRLGYLGQLRIDPACRGKWLVSRGFSQLQRLHLRDPLPAYLASIVGGNDEATGVLVEKRRKIFPVFQTVADYSTLAKSFDQVAGGTQPILQGRIRFIPDPSDGQKIGVEVWRCNLAPNGQIGLIADDYGNWTLDASILDDSANHPDAPYYLATFE